jgi:hypothetical protein
MGVWSPIHAAVSPCKQLAGRLLLWMCCRRRCVTVSGCFLAVVTVQEPVDAVVVCSRLHANDVAAASALKQLRQFAGMLLPQGIVL